MLVSFVTADLTGNLSIRPIDEIPDFTRAERDLLTSNNYSLEYETFRRGDNRWVILKKEVSTIKNNETITGYWNEEVPCPLSENDRVEVKEKECILNYVNKDRTPNKESVDRVDLTKKTGGIIEIIK